MRRRRSCIKNLLDSFKIFHGVFKRPVWLLTMDKKNLIKRQAICRLGNI